jgi:hypothetical protein
MIEGRGVFGTKGDARAAEDGTFGNVGELALPAHRRAGDASRRVRIATTFEQRHKVANQEEDRTELYSLKDEVKLEAQVNVKVKVK